MFKRKILVYEVILGGIILGSLAYILGMDSKYILGYFYGIMAALFGTVFTLFNAKYIKKVDAAKITKRAHKNGTTLKEESIKSGLITEKEYDKIVNPKKMITPQ